ncbi:PDC sensor domain-containing protein [Tropicibacter sp. S64]|uniref:PDC sensor domain-containing protein n=1 Tax=Tropicibacter sp. S64 TaxID=3415122 RepID=UPI003C7B6BC6
MKFTLSLTAALALTAGLAHAGEPNPAMQAYLGSEIMPWAHDAVLIDAIAAQNAVTHDYDAARIEALDQAWRAEVGAAATPTIDPVLHNAASDFLRDRVMASGGAITEVFIMDAHGLNVAASGVTSDYWQGDEDKFQQTYSVGPDAVHFSEIEFDESSQSFQAQISIPLKDASGAVIGAMTVGVNADMLM